MKLLTGFFMKLRSRDLSAAVPPAFTTTDGVPLMAECDLYGNQLVLPMMFTAGAGFPAPVPFTSRGNNSDAVAPIAAGNLAVINFGYIFDNVNWDRNRSASAANLAATSGLGSQLSSSPGEWSVNHLPAVGVQATITRAGVAGRSHICRSITAAISAGAAVSAVSHIVLRDGVSGVGAILWGAVLNAPINYSDNIVISGLNIVGTSGNAMTLEFLAAGVATDTQSVSLTGYDAI